MVGFVCMLLSVLFLNIFKCTQLGVEHFDLQVSYGKWALGFVVPCINVLNSTVGNIKAFSFHINLNRNFNISNPTTYSQVLL